MNGILYDYGYKTLWTNVHVRHKEGYYSSVTDFHEHDFYEINLILSGNTKILLSNQTKESTQGCIVLTRPGTPHFISCRPDTLYSRLYLLFSDEFISDYVPEWSKLSEVFGNSGRIVPISQEQKDFCSQIIKRIENETKNFRRRLLILYLLSYISEFAGVKDTSFTAVPAYITEALIFIDKHYSEKIVAAELAKKLNVGRTTLMTSFKKYTGMTLNNYLIYRRLKTAIKLMQSGKTEQEAAELCGLNDSSSLIRCFKRNFKLTPRQYLLHSDI